MSRSLTAAVTTEVAKDQNRPIDLYKLYLVSGNIFFAATNEDVSFFDPDTAGVQVYTAAAISRSSIRINANAQIDDVAVQVQNADRTFTSEVNNLEIRGVRIRIFKVFLDALAAATDRIDIFDGEIDSPTVTPTLLSVSLVPRMNVQSLLRQGPGRRWQAQCNWKFGEDPGCTFDISSTAVTAQTTDGGSTDTIIVDAARTEADGFWKHGKVTFTSGSNNGVVRKVIASDLSSTNFTMDHPLPVAPSPGDLYSVEQGCAHTLVADCTNRFSNNANFGGFPTLPQQLIIR